MQKLKQELNANPVGANCIRPHFEGITLKKQNGITLIALIITIIVMLILVGVTINVALNGGLFQKAETATRETEEKAILEEMLAMLEITDDGKFNYSTIIIEIGKKYEVESYNYPNATIKGKLGTYNYIVSETEIKIGPKGNTPVTFDWTTVGLTVDTNTEYISEEGIILNFTKDGKVIATVGTDITILDATKAEGELGFNIDIEGSPVNTTITMANQTDVNVILGGTETFTCIKILVDNETVYSNEEVLKKLGITNYTGSYVGTWTKIGTENGKTKLVSTRNVGTYTLGYEDPKAIEAIPAANESAPTESEKYQRSIWSYKNSVNTLNTIAQETTGITSARSITLEDLEQLITVDRPSESATTYNYSNHKGQTFVNENGETIIIDSVGDEITLNHSYMFTDLSEDEIKKVGPLAYYSCALASPCIHCYRDYADFRLFNWIGDYIGDVYMFSSDGSAYSESRGVGAIIYIP